MPKIHEKIVQQINDSPEPLRSYIHDLETTMGNVAHLIQEEFMLREKVEYLELILERKEEQIMSGGLEAYNVQGQYTGTVTKAEDKKWMRRLTKKRVRQILDMEPSDVWFTINAPKIIICQITTKEGTGVGVALCSVLDKQNFNLAIGKTIASGRALIALSAKKNLFPIRKKDGKFPRRWLPSQIKQVLHYSVHKHKAEFIPNN